MAKEDTDDKDVMRLDWLQHEYTAKWAKTSAEKAAAAHKLFMATCSKSTDPEVRAAYTTYIELATISAFLRTGGTK